MNILQIQKSIVAQQLSLDLSNNPNGIYTKLIHRQAHHCYPIRSGSSLIF
jgi:hypothetical protein